MINFIVSLFRAAIGFLFIALLIVVFSMISMPGAGGPFGAVLAAGILLVGAMSLGIAATLIAINDNLVKLGGVPTPLDRSGPVQPIDPAERKEMTDRQRKNFLIAGGAVILIIVVLQVSERFGPADAENTSNTIYASSPASERASNSADAEGYDPKASECVPELAASVGATCE